MRTGIKLSTLNLFNTERPTGKKFGVMALIGLTLIPALLAASFQWTQADATEHLDKIEAAVVNHDQPVTVDGELLPLGRLLVMRLTDKDSTPINITWTLTDEADAQDGLDSGRFASAVIIPEDFSKNATSGSMMKPNKIEPAVLDVRTSTTAGLIDPTVGHAVSSTITSALNTELASEYVKNIFLQFRDMKRKLGKAVWGSGKLAGGLDQAYDGSLELVDGLNKLAWGTDQVADGNEELAAGLAQAADELRDAPAKIQLLADGSHMVKDGLFALNDTVQSYRGSLRDVTDTLRDVNARTRVQQSQLAALSTELAALDGQLAETVALCEAQETKDPACEQVLSLDATISSVRGDLGVDTSGELLVALLAAMKDLDYYADQANAAVTGINDLAWGASKVAGGVDQLNEQMPRLVDGMILAADGSAQLAWGARQVADGAALGADQAGQLPSGMDQLRDGAYQLHDGLEEGQQQIPSFDEEQSAALAVAMAAPVTPFDPTLPDPDLSAGYFTALALAIAALVVFMLIRAVPQHAVSSSRNAFSLMLQSYWPALAIAGLQTVAIAAALQVSMQLSLVTLSAFSAVVFVAAAAMYAVGQALVAALGGAGRFLAILVIAISAPTALVSTTPEVLQVLVDLTPIAPTIDALRGVITGANVAAEISALVVWLVAGLAVTVASITRDRRVRVSSVVQAA
ncbi:MAG TPA: YhgE/Pip family protein [Nocardioidaceae bacterium]|nr:YhgE/Pip family protein [Nocardioidaceae bacterium]